MKIDKSNWKYCLENLENEEITYMCTHNLSFKFQFQDISRYWKSYQRLNKFIISYNTYCNIIFL